MGNVIATLRAVNGLTRERRSELLDARQEPEEWLGPRGSTRTFKNAQGYDIAAYFWPAEDPKGQVVLVHGLGAYLVFEYCRNRGVGRPKTYEGSWVQALNEAGYSVAGVDNQGAGRSGGLFGYVGSFDDYVSDLLQLAALLRGPGPRGGGAPRGFGRALPTFALGCSLGGCIALRASMREPGWFRGLVLLAPMLSLERVKRAGSNWLLVPLAKVLSAVVPTLPIVATPKNFKFPELQRDWCALIRPPLLYIRDVLIPSLMRMFGLPWLPSSHPKVTLTDLSNSQQQHTTTHTTTQL